MSGKRMLSVNKATFRHICTLEVKQDRKFSPKQWKIFIWFHSLSKYKQVRSCDSSKQFFRSSKALAREKERHLNTPEFRLTIHPFSKIALIQQIVMTFIWFILFILAPILGSFYFHTAFAESNPFPSAVICDYCCRMVVLGYIIMRFFSGYIDAKTHEIILDRKKIARHYLHTFFFFDMGPIVSFLFIVAIHEKIARLIAFHFTYLVWPRFFTFRNSLDTILREIFSFKEETRTVIRLVIQTMLLIHWLTCILKVITVVYHETDNPNLANSWYSVYISEEMSNEIRQRIDKTSDILLPIKDYVIHMSQIACHFFGAAWGYYRTKDASEMFFLAIVVFIGMTYYIYICARVLELFGTINVGETKYEELLYQAKHFMMIDHYPKRLRKRILDYYSYKYNKVFFDEEKVLAGLTEHLRMEVILYSSQNLINTSRSLRGLSKSCIGSFLALLKSEIYLPKDVIMSIETSDLRYFFILYGTCSVQLLTSDELMHSEDGDSFGNALSYLAKDYQPTFLYKVVAVEPCEIYELKADDLKWCCAHNQALAERLFNLATARDKLQNELYAKGVEAGGSLTSLDIITELRRKRIIEHGRPRLD